MAFLLVARFRTPKRAQMIYMRVERTLYQGDPSDLSAYNVIFDGIPHVVVLGEDPPARLQEQLTHLLAAGQIADLPVDVVATLRRRREQEHGKGRWAEGHYRPGLRLPVEPTKPDHG